MNSIQSDITSQNIKSTFTLTESDDTEGAYDEGITELNAEFIEEDSDSETESIEPDDIEYDGVYRNKPNCSNHQKEVIENIKSTDKKEEVIKKENNDTKTKTVRLRSNHISLSNETTSRETTKRKQLDSVRFSMYNIQNTHLNEIDALLNELNQLQTSLEYIEPHEMPTTTLKNSSMDINNNRSDFLNKNPSSNKMTKNYNSEEIEIIDQQFDEVLKFLAESINGNSTDSHKFPNVKNINGTGSESPNGTDSSNSPTFSDSDKFIYNKEVQKINDGLSGSGSNSSGIGEDFYTINQHKSLKPEKIYPKTKKRDSSDSAFADTISIPSSGESRNLNQPLCISSSDRSGENSSEPSPIEKILNPEEEAEKNKAELIRIALEKLKEANIKKLIVKAYTDDGCTKSVIIDETMKIYDVQLMLFNKNHTKPSIDYSIVEYLPKFHMERIFEDHENLVEAMSNWSRDSENQIIFTEKSNKSDLFKRPDFYLQGLNETFSKIDDFQRTKLLNDFFQNIGSPVPDVEGILYFKIESKKSWKKFYCVLRQSGMYYNPKSKNKKDLKCLFNFDKLDLYFGIDWKKEFKSPTDFCFALKYPQVQKKSSKYIKYICCESDKEMKRWFNGIRIAKFGKQLLENYKQTLDLIRTNEQTGRLPMVPNRRLSTSVSNNSIRPRSSYSMNQNISQNIENNDIECTARHSVITTESPENKLPEKSSLLMRQNMNYENTKINGSNSLQRTESNVSYTDQLKTLLQAHQNLKLENQNNVTQDLDIGFSKYQERTRDGLQRTPSPQNTSTLRAKPKLPLSTDITKHMLNSNTLYSNINDSEINETVFHKPCKNSLQTELLLSEYQNVKNEIKIDDDKDTVNREENPVLPHQMYEYIKPFSSHIVRNSEKVHQAPPVAPKPVFKRFNSLQPTDNHKEVSKNIEISSNKGHNFRKFNLNTNNIPKNRNRSSTCSNNSEKNHPELISELSSILARQKKKIDDAENNQVVVSKPPAPPRRVHS